MARLNVKIEIDGALVEQIVDTRTSLLDMLREDLGVYSVKKGCDQGQCGACTVLVDRRRVLACLTFAVASDGSEVVTAAGLSSGTGGLHPVAQAILDHDGLQCGYCTPGQICSAVGLIQELAAGWRSSASAQADGDPTQIDINEIREGMSGNLCRCGAYSNIAEAVRSLLK